MPTYNPEITVSSRVAGLVADAAARAQQDEPSPLPPLTWYIQEVRKLTAGIAFNEYQQQKFETPDPNEEAIDGEVTI